MLILYYIKIYLTVGKKSKKKVFPCILFDGVHIKNIKKIIIQTLLGGNVMKLFKNSYLNKSYKSLNLVNNKQFDNHFYYT